MKVLGIQIFGCSQSLIRINGDPAEIRARQLPPVRQGHQGHDLHGRAAGAGQTVANALPVTFKGSWMISDSLGHSSQMQEP